MGSNLEMTMRELMAESPTYDIRVGECKSLSVMCLVCFQTSQIEICLVPEEISVFVAVFLMQKSEEMKKKGNDHFQEQDYEQAIRFYSKAIGFK